MKKLLSIILVIVMLCSTFAGLQITSSATTLPSSGSCGTNVTYTFDSSTGMLTISGSGVMTNYSSSESPFYYQPAIKAIVIENGVTSIGNEAFYGCSGLTSVTIPDSVTSIGGSAFRNCRGLTSITIPDSVTSIGNYAFYGCNGLTSVTIGNSVTSIGGSAFQNCSELTSITIPNSVTSISSYAFSGCSGLTSITIPDSVTSIGNYAFQNCSGLTSVIYRGTQENWNTISIGSNNDGLTNAQKLYCPPNKQGSCGDNVTYSYTCANNIGVLTISGTGKMTDYASASTSPFYNLCVDYLIIKNGVTGIGNYSFYGSAVIKSITIPDSVTSIGSYTFYGCSGLTSITIPDSVTSIGSDAFFGCSGLTSVNISSIEAWCKISFRTGESNPFCYAQNLYLNGELITDLAIPDSVTSIGSSAFRGCSGLTSITIPDSVTSIGDYAFRNCSGLTSVTIPNSVTSISKYAFSGCSGLTSVTIPDSVTSIGDYAFQNCSGLTSVTIGNSVKSIGSYAFSGCSGLTSITIPNSITSISKYEFSGCSGLTSITIPDSVTSISSYAFSGCSGLTSITIPDSVTSISSSAFSDCSGLTSVTIPDSVTSIGNYAFSGCSGLKELTMPCSAKIYNSGDTFKNCTNIEKVTLTKGAGTMRNYASSSSASDTYYQYTPWYISRSNLKELVIEDGVKNIGNYAFRGCSGLTSITIPDSVTSIGTCAFYNCSGLTNVTIGNSVQIINADILKSCTNIESVYLYSKAIDSTQNLVATMPAGSTLYAYEDTDAQLYCSIYGVNFVPLKEPQCDKGIHTYIETITQAATCEEAGIKTFTCRFCGDTLTETIPAAGHSPVADAGTAPTCTQSGLSDGSHCAVCGKVLQAQEVLPAEHHWSDWQVVAAPTSESAGTVMRICSVCNTVEEKEYPALHEHRYAAEVTEPTCTHTGYTTYTCTDCGYSYIGDIVPVAEHSFIDTVTEPTTESQGYTVHTCKDCGYSYVDSITDILPSQMHYIIPSLADIQATVTIKSDENEYSVTAANGVFELESIKGDVYRVYAKQKNSLTVCVGEYDTKSGEITNDDAITFPLGDVNGDDVIDIADLSMLLSSGNYGQDNDKIDLTGDNIITIDDIAVALQTQNYGKSSVSIV